MKLLNVLSAGKLLKFMLFFVPVARFSYHAFLPALYRSYSLFSLLLSLFMCGFEVKCTWRYVVTMKQTNRGDRDGNFLSVEMANGILK